ncbi:MAG: hypothetical protein DI535_17900 [Citrobacter freundii]|nr:MAG: hypothetical protein DI535_17900 [Citrobacter freundii]
MNKIIAAVDALKPSMSTMTYAIEAAKANQAHLVVVLLDDPGYTSYRVYDLITAEGGVIGSAKQHMDKKDAKTRAQSASKFEEACVQAKIEYTIHHDRGFALQDLVHETTFADLLIIDMRETLEHNTQKPPTDFIRELLIKTNCPVLIVPHLYRAIEQVVFLYDGESASVRALKSFHYAMPALIPFKMKTLFVNWTGVSNHVPDDHLLKEWMKRHHESVEYITLHGDPEEEIVNFLRQQKETSLVVLGAYRRSRLSRWLKPSKADLLMRELRSVLFIAPR